MSDLGFLQQNSRPEPASLKQIKFFRDLIAKKQLDDMIKGMPDAFLIVMRDLTKAIHETSIEQVEESKVFAKTDLIKFISQMLKQPDKPKELALPAAMIPEGHPATFKYSEVEKWKEASAVTTPRPEVFNTTLVLEDGMYRHTNGTFYKVYHTVRGANIQVAKRLYQKINGKWSFKYEGRKPLRILKPSMRLTMDEAREFGALYGTCMICARTLTNELSIHLGIGPVCGRREFGGEFEFMINKAKVATGAQEVIDVDDFDVQYHDTNEDKVRLINEMVKHGMLTETEAEVKIKELS